jgi:hypothetical protein
MRSRSNSAKAANTWKTSLPPGVVVVVSIASWRLRNPTPRSVRPVTVSTRWPRARPRLVQLPDDQGVAGAQLGQQLLEGGAVGAGAAGGLGEDPVAAGALEGVDLEVGLLVGGGDAGVAEQMAHAADGCRTL